MGGLLIHLEYWSRNAYGKKNSVNQIRLLLEEQPDPGLHCLPRKLHGPSMFTVKAKIYGVLYKQSSSIAFVETSSYWSAPKSS